MIRHRISAFTRAIVPTAVLALALAATDGSAQQRIDGTFAFDTDPAKQYSLYIPSNYMPGTPHRMMIGFHPLNTNRWNSISWCDTLLMFAETNGLILACPDGGEDGRVDDPIDFGFTEALTDSMFVWYDIDVGKIYAMGFSWGGRATYTYGLSHADVFGGYIPIGAAINGTTEVGPFLGNAEDETFYIVHGALDQPNNRFFPVRDALIANGANVEWLLMDGVGHTIDFPNRNEILGEAFEWVDLVNCFGVVAVGDDVQVSGAGPFVPLPSPVTRGTRIALEDLFDARVNSVSVFDLTGRRISNDVSGIDTQALSPGTYLVRVTTDNETVVSKLVVY